MSFQNPVFVPGPTNIPEAIRKACDMPTIDHRSPLFTDILRPALDGVRKVLKSETAEIFVFPASGTGGWEAAVTNCLSPGDKVLAARNGMFSHLWIEMCRKFDLDVEVVAVEWGEGIPADRFHEILAADTDHKIKAVLATHNETATGVASDVAAVRRAIDEAGHPAMLFVDGVSSIASIDFRMDEWKVDVAVTGSQKGFMLPAGLAILGVSQKAMASLDASELRRSYFDFRWMKNGYDQGSYPYTPSAGMLNGLKLSCEMLLGEGLEAVFARHRRIAEGVRAAVRGWGFETCAKRPEIESDTVTAIRTPEGFDAQQVVIRAREDYGVAFGGGLGDVAGKVFRIGHLGMLSDVQALSGIATAEMVMADLGMPIQLGSGVAAAQDSYRVGSATTLARAAE